MSNKTDPRQARSSSPAERAGGSASGGAETGRSYFMSSIDLQSGLEVSEEELQTLPPEFEAMFGRPAAAG